MLQMEMTDKEQITMLMRTLAELTERFGATETKLDRILSCQTGGGGISTLIPKKNVMGLTYWKADSKQIWDQGGYCWRHGYCMNPGHSRTTCHKLVQQPGHKDKTTHKDTMGELLWGNMKI